jgi:hypothetical protein
LDLSSFDEIFKYIGILSLILGFFWSLHKTYSHFIKPKRNIFKYHKLFEMIEDWFDEIDKNLEASLNYSLLNNKENKIRQYLLDSGISNHKLKFNKNFRKRYLKFIGINKSHLNDVNLFAKYSRQPIDWIYIEDYIGILFGAFYTFSNDYNANNGKANFAEIEMRVKLLKLYWNYKRK